MTCSNAQSLTDSLVVLYHFNGNNADSSGNGNDCIVNGVTLVADRHGISEQAYFFDGIDDFVEVPYSGLIQSDPPITLAM